MQRKEKGVKQFNVTIFPNQYAHSMSVEKMTLIELRDRVQNTSRANITFRQAGDIQRRTHPQG